MGGKIGPRDLTTPPAPARVFRIFPIFQRGSCAVLEWPQGHKMVADPLREKVVLYRWELERADRLLANPNLPAVQRPKLERVRSVMEDLLRDAEARLEARETNRSRAVETEETALDAPTEKARSRWRRNLIAGVMGLMFFAALYHPTAQRAYYTDAEVFLGMVIFLPLLAGLFTALGILLFDFIRSPTEQEVAVRWLAEDPIAATKEIVRFSATATFLGCILLSFFGLEWLLATWVFWTAGGVALVMALVR